MLSVQNITFQVMLLCLMAAMLRATSVDPLSKITIKSNRATCSKNKIAQQEVVLKYLDDVQVEFADHSTVHARELEVVCNLKKTNKTANKAAPEKSASVPVKSRSEKTDKALSHLKKISFIGNVVMSKDEFKATADSADVTIADRLCLLKGNVHIQHTKKTAQDFPVDVKSQAATIKLDSQQILFAGSSKNPVSTVINLEDHPIIRKKKNKKEGKVEKKGVSKKA